MRITNRILIALLALASMTLLGGLAAAQRQGGCGVSGCTQFHVGLSTTIGGAQIGIQYQSDCGTRSYGGTYSYRTPQRFYRSYAGYRRPVVYRRPYYRPSYRYGSYQTYRRPVASRVCYY